MLLEENNLPKNPTSKKNKLIADIFVITGIVLVAVSVMFAIKIFFPVAREEIKYQLYKENKNSNQKESDSIQKETVPVDSEFGIVVPKILANAKIIPEVDAQNSAVYQRALTKGVAHAKGSSYPGEGGNIFIFAHSSADILEANKYNAVFYLLSKMEKGDDIFVYHKKQKYHYIVSEKKNVNSDEVRYMEKTPKEQLTLMTCWPPGTTMKRLIVLAELTPNID